MRYMNSQNTINRIAIGILICLIAVFCCLSLFGALGGVGLMVSSFLVGAFGYASYAYFICLLIIGIAIIFNFTPRIEGRKIVGLVLLLVVGIWALHVYTSSANSLADGYGGYLNACYKNRNTAGGALFGIISYPIQRFFTNVGALVFTCVLFFIMVFIAVYPFIKGTVGKNRKLKLRKKPRGEKITTPKVPTLTSFDDTRPPTFYKLTDDVAEEPPKNTVGADGYNPIFPNKTGHIEDEEKIDGRGVNFALGGEEMNNREHDISRGTFGLRKTETERDFSRQSSSKNLVREMLFGNEMDNEKYKEYLSGRQSEEHNIDGSAYTALQNAYKNTMMREQLGTAPTEPVSLTNAISNAEAKRNALNAAAKSESDEKPVSRTAVPSGYDYNNPYSSQIFRNPQNAQQNQTTASSPAINQTSGIKRETGGIEFEKLKEEQRELFKENSRIRQSQFANRIVQPSEPIAASYGNTGVVGNGETNNKVNGITANNAGFVNNAARNNISDGSLNEYNHAASNAQSDGVKNTSAGFAFNPSSGQSRTVVNEFNGFNPSKHEVDMQEGNPNGYHSVETYRGTENSNNFAEVKNFNDKHVSGYNPNYRQFHDGGVSADNPNGYQNVSSQYGRVNNFANNLNYPAANLYGANKQTWQEIRSGFASNGHTSSGEQTAYNGGYNDNYPSNGYSQNGGTYTREGYPQNGYPQGGNAYNRAPYGQSGYSDVTNMGGYSNNNAASHVVNPQYNLYPQPQQFGGVNYNWTPNGYVPVQPVPFVQPNVIYQPVQVVPTNVSNVGNVPFNDGDAKKESGSIGYDELKPLQSSNFTLNPDTGVYSNPHNSESVAPKTYAPDPERGKRLNIEAEARRQSEDVKRDRLKRMEELKRRQAERNAKRAAEENAQRTAMSDTASTSRTLNLDEYSAAVERGRINAEVLKPNPSDNRIVSTSSVSETDGGNRWRSVGESNIGISAEEKAKRGFGAFAGKVGGFGGGNSLRTEAVREVENASDYHIVNADETGYGLNGTDRAINEADDYPDFNSDRIAYHAQGETSNGALRSEETEIDEEAERIEAERRKYLERHNKKKGKNDDPKVRTAQITIEESIEKTEPRAPYVAPPIDLLIPPEIKTGPGEDIEEKKEALISTLAYFNVKAKIVDVVCGPAFSLFRLMIEEMPRGKTINWLQSLENDLAMKMAEISVKILTPIPGENLVGVEVSNKNRRMVRISSIIKSQEFENAKTPVSFALGEDIYGKNYVCEVRSLPHMLVAGQTGAGKSCCINTLIVSMLFHASPDDVRFIMIDPKRTELSIYKGIPHLLLDDIIYDADKAIKALQWGIEEMQRRIEFFNKNGYRDIEEYNACKLEDDFVPMPRIVIIIDELAELMDRGSKTVESCIDRLARLARAVGIHLICATQRPSVDVVSGTIKNNLTSRIAFRVPTQGDSRTVLGVGGAENLLGDGDLLYMNPKLKSSVRMQGAFISTSEVKNVVDFLKMNNTCIYDSKIKDEIYKEDEKEETQSDNGGVKKQSTISQELIDALRIGLDGVPLSISMLQRKLGVGFPKAGKIYDQIERMGYFGPPSKPNGARPVTITQEEYDDLVAEFEGDDD